MNLKEIFKRENRDRSIPLLLLLFAVGVQVPLFLYGGGMCKCGYMVHLNSIYPYPINIIIGFLMLSFPIIITGSSYLYLKSNGYKKTTIATLSSITLLLCIFDMMLCGFLTIIALIFFVIIIIQSLLNIEVVDDRDIFSFKKKLILIGSQLFAIIFFGSLALSNLQVNFVLSASIIISIIAIYFLARFLVIKYVKRVIL